jgi:hypothetical protein
MATSKSVLTDKERAVIQETVNAGLAAGRVQASSTARDSFKATERRLYAITLIEKKVINDREKLADIKTDGTSQRSKSIVRFKRTGYRVSPEEMLEAIINDLEATIAADEYELETVRGAMEVFKGDKYYLAVTGKYIDRYDDADIADELECSTAQVYKQRTRIVKDIAVMLYGAAATA